MSFMCRCSLAVVLCVVAVRCSKMEFERWTQRDQARARLRAASVIRAPHATQQQRHCKRAGTRTDTGGDCTAAGEARRADGARRRSETSRKEALFRLSEANKETGSKETQQHGWMYLSLTHLHRFLARHSSDVAVAEAEMHRPRPSRH